MSTRHLRRITDIPCTCPRCLWEGVTGQCESDVDGDGGLGCPDCWKEGIAVVVEQHPDDTSVYLGVVE